MGSGQHVLESSSACTPWTAAILLFLMCSASPATPRDPTAASPPRTDRHGAIPQQPRLPRLHPRIRILLPSPPRDKSKCHCGSAPVVFDLASPMHTSAYPDKAQGWALHLKPRSGYRQRYRQHHRNCSQPPTTTINVDTTCSNLRPNHLQQPEPSSSRRRHCDLAPGTRTGRCPTDKSASTSCRLP